MTKEQQLMESRAGDYIRANKLSKEEALKPENIKKIRAAMDPKDPTRPSVANAKTAIENVFNGKEKRSNGKAGGKSANKSKNDKSSGNKQDEPLEKSDDSSNDSKNDSKSDKTSKTDDSNSKDTKDSKDEKKDEKKDKEESSSANELSSEEKKEVVDAVKQVDLDLSSTEAARKQAEQNPIKGYSLSKKMYFVHVGAKKKAEEAIKKYLQSAKAGEINVKVTNSAIDSSENTFDTSADKYIIGVHVLLDKTTVAGLRKFMAVIKESQQLDEGLMDGLKSLFGRVKQAVKDGVSDVKAEAQKKIDATNEKMKELIGVLAIKAYITHFIGKRIGDEIDANLVYAGINESGKYKGRISYYTAITLK